MTTELTADEIKRLGDMRAMQRILLRNSGKIAKLRAALAASEQRAAEAEATIRRYGLEIEERGRIMNVQAAALSATPPRPEPPATLHDLIRQAEADRDEQSGTAAEEWCGGYLKGLRDALDALTTPPAAAPSVPDAAGPDTAMIRAWLVKANDDLNHIMPRTIRDANRYFAVKGAIGDAVRALTPAAQQAPASAGPGKDDAFQREVGDWAGGTFPASTLETVCAHLSDEVAELGAESDPRRQRMEAADCYLLLLHYAHKAGFSLTVAAREKFTVNRARQWGEPDARGVVRHVSAGPGDDAGGVMNDAAVRWIVGGDTGQSSKTIWAAMMGVDCARPAIPYDAADFGRCDRLLLTVPEWEGRLAEVAARYPQWTPIVAIWGRLVPAYRDHAWVSVGEMLRAARDAGGGTA